MLAACSLHSLDGLERCTGKPSSDSCPSESAKGGDAGAAAGTGANAGSGGASGTVGVGGVAGGSAGAPVNQAGMGGDAGGVGAGGAVDTGLVLLYADHSHVDHDPTTAARAVRPTFLIENRGDAPVPVAQLSIRYFYTLEAAATQTFLCDFVHPDAVVNECAGVQGAFGTLSGKAAKNYLEVSFVPPAGETWELPAFGGQSGTLQLRFYNGTFQDQDQTNDYSFNPTIVDDPAEWDHVTLYRNGNLVYGVEPQ